MSLAPGTRLGPYEIESAIGAGGMGEVYKAIDTRLSRTVAIKVLPPHWADSVEMRQRFEREAKTVASLNHPHICAIHDIGHQDGVDFLVMEFLQGETLAARIARSPLPVAEALTIAIEVTDALDQAHRRGVVHRDLKPANVMLVRSGGASGPPTAKLLDFGLAKVTPIRSPSGSGTVQPVAADVTTPGMVLGTLQYMAPEQLEGTDADARTDIFGLGMLIHEMVTGKKAFAGTSRVLLISAIATSTPPPLSSAAPATPPELEHVVSTCLAKDPADRWQTARDVLAELKALAEGGTETVSVALLPAAGHARPRRFRVLAAAAIVLAMIVSAPALLYLRGAEPPAEIRFRIPMQLTAQPGTANLGGVAAGALLNLASAAVSPDGRSIAYAARASTNDPWTLFVRPVGAVVPRALPGTNDAAQPFWSADSRTVGFVAEGRLKKVAVSGGPPQDLGEAKDFSGGAWNKDGVIIFGSSKGLFRVPAEGGKPEALTTIGPSETGHFWPQFLPDGRHYLYSAWSDQAAARAIYAGVQGEARAAASRILAAESNAVYVGDGQLLFHRGSTVYAQAFDVKTSSLSGEPVTVADQVSFNSADGRGHFHASEGGVLIYFQNSGMTGTTAFDAAEWHMAWVNRSAQPVGTPGPGAMYRGFEPSPDMTRIAAHRHEAGGGDVWVTEPSGSETRLTWNAAQHNSSPIWSPDGRDIVFASLRDGKWGLYRKRSDGSSTEELLHESATLKAPMSWSPDGKSIVFWVRDAKTQGDLWLLSVADKKAAPLIATPFNETHGQISPDGKWLAYTSDSVGGRREIQVQPFPSGEGRWQVSDAGGDWPRWRKDTKELFYHSLGITATPAAAGPTAFVGPLYSVSVNAAGATFEHTAPAALMNLAAINFPHDGGDYQTYSVAPDGQRFLYLQFVQPGAANSGQTSPDQTSGLIVAMNWADKLKKK